MRKKTTKQSDRPPLARDRRPPARTSRPAPARAGTARTSPRKAVLLLAGTRHGLFLFRAAPDRRRFELKATALLGLPVADAALDPRTGIVYAAAGGRAPGVYQSRDLGRTWLRRGAEIGASAFSLLAFGHASAPKTLYAAADPALLHRSTDGGESWSAVWSLNEHPSRREWLDLGCSQHVAAFLQDPREPERLFAAVTGAGVFRSDDGALTWQPRNAGLPCHSSSLAIFPGLGGCPHNLALGSRGTLWLHGHDGLWRSTDRAETWSDRTRALPSRFGRALVAHPREDVVWVVPESSQALTTHGDLALWRGSAGGRDWERCGRGLPGRAHVSIAPRALAADGLDPLGLYLGTSSGKLFASRDEGRSFARVAEDLPELLSVSSSLVEA